MRPYDEFRALAEIMHDYEDLRDLREAKQAAKGEKGIPFEQAISELEP